MPALRPSRHRMQKSGLSQPALTHTSAIRSELQILPWEIKSQVKGASFCPGLPHPGRDSLCLPPLPFPCSEIACSGGLFASLGKPHAIWCRLKLPEFSQKPHLLQDHSRFGKQTGARKSLFSLCTMVPIQRKPRRAPRHGIYTPYLIAQKQLCEKAGRRAQKGGRDFLCF